MDIEIRYRYLTGYGQMVVHLEAFFKSSRNLTRVKDLLKIIRTSDTPECEQQIRQYISNYNNVQYDIDKNEEKAAIAQYEKEIRDLQTDLDNYLAKRNAEKKHSAGWNRWDDKAYECKVWLSDKKDSLKSVQRRLNNTEREKAFLGKCLNLLQ